MIARVGNSKFKNIFFYYFNIKIKCKEQIESDSTFIQINHKSA